MTNPIYITDSYGNKIAIAGGSGGIASQKATEMAKEISNQIANGTAQTYTPYSFPPSSNPVPSDITPITIMNSVGNIPLSSSHTNQYLISPYFYNYDLNMGLCMVETPRSFTSDYYVNILMGSYATGMYQANEESGRIVSTGKNNNFDTLTGSYFNATLAFSGAGKSGNWSIYSDEADDTIITTNGNNTIYAGTGNNIIRMGTGTNEVYSEGYDTIRGGGSETYQSITLAGGFSSVRTEGSTFITDLSQKNTISVNANSTVSGSKNSSILFQSLKGSGEFITNPFFYEINDHHYSKYQPINSDNSFIGGSNNTISASYGGNLKVIGGNNNNITLSQDIASSSGQLTFLNGTGKTNITSDGQTNIFGANQLNMTLNANGNDGNLFVAGNGNETLNGSTSTGDLEIYAHTISGAQTSFIAKGGSGNDSLTAGTGKSTFSGGSGDNLFIFTKATAANGSTVITDFAQSENNQIALFDYGLTRSSLKQLLKNSYDDSQGNALLNLENHNITLQGVSVSDLSTNQFFVYNNPKT